MSGRAKIKCFQYDEKGNYLRSYDSITEVKEKYYSKIKGTYPFFRETKYEKISKDNYIPKYVEKNYHKLPDGSFLFKQKLQKHLLKKIIRTDNCEYCNVSKLRINKQIEVYNLKEEKVAEFENSVIAALLLEETVSTINNKLTHNSYSKGIGKLSNLIFKYKL